MTYNPVWLAFLRVRGMTPEAADALPRPARISLNADFICWSMGGVKPWVVYGL